MNHSPRSRLLRLFAAWPVAAALPRAQADTYPSRPVRLIVPWPAGGLVDIAARQLARPLAASLGQPVVVDNRVGAAGAIGADAVAKAAPDGHVLGLTSSALTIGAAMRAKLPYAVPRDFEPVTMVALAPSVLVVGPAIAPASVAALIELARSRPGRLSYASAGIGSPAHLTTELFKTRYGLRVVHIPYTGAPGAMTDQIGGQVDFQFANAAVALPAIRSGKVKALAVTSARRFAALPDVPTMIEAGVPGFEADQWLGVLGPRGLPAPVRDRLAADIGRALTVPELRAAFAQAGMAVAEATGAAPFAATIERELETWSRVVKAAGIEPE